MKHEITIKNGTAGVEINGRFYTHNFTICNFCRIIDVDSDTGWKWVAEADNEMEEAYIVREADLTPIPNPALEWPKGTKVLVRQDSSQPWHKRNFWRCDEDFIFCQFADSDAIEIGWSQCKLAEAE